MGRTGSATGPGRADPPPLECRDVVKRYGPVVGVDGVDLRVDAGSVKGFLGPNGAGKTTLLRVATGLLHADRGHVSLFGVDASDPGSRRGVGVMSADPAFYPALTGRENLDLAAALHGEDVPDRAWAADLLELSDADLDRGAGTYSSGMRQKLALVMAFQHRPRLVVLDEPANRLDPLAQRAFEELVRAVAGAGRSVLLSSHTLPEVDRLCDEIAMIRGGRILLDGPADELRAHALRRVTVRYDSQPVHPPGALRDVQVDGTRVQALVPRPGLDVLRELLADPGVVDVLVEPPRLDDVFHELYAGTSGVGGDEPVGEVDVPPATDREDDA